LCPDEAGGDVPPGQHQTWTPPGPASHQAAWRTWTWPFCPTYLQRLGGRVLADVQHPHPIVLRGCDKTSKRSTEKRAADRPSATGARLVKVDAAVHRPGRNILIDDLPNGPSVWVARLCV
jgi:hypothetical protein